MYLKSKNREVSIQEIDNAAKKMGWTRDQAFRAIEQINANNSGEENQQQEGSSILGAVGKLGLNTALQAGKFIANPVEAFQPFAKGIIGAGDSVMGYPAELANMILPKDRQLALPHNAEGEEYETGKLIGDAATFMGAGGIASKGLQYGAKLAPGLGEMLTSQKFLPGLVRRAAGSAAYGASKMPGEDETRGGNAKSSATISALVDSAFGAAKAPVHLGVNLYNKYAHDEITKAIEAAKGLAIPLGDIIQSPFLKKLYDLGVNKVVGSGSVGTGQKLKRQLQNEANQIWKGFGGDSTVATVEKDLNNKMVKRYESLRKEKNKKYNEVQRMADAEGYAPNIDEFSKDLRKVVSKNTAKDLFSHINPDYGDVKSVLSHYGKEAKSAEQLIAESGALKKRITELQRKSNQNRGVEKDIEKASLKYGIPAEVLEKQIYGQTKAGRMSLKDEYELKGSQKVKSGLDREITKDIRTPEDLNRGLERFSDPNPIPLSYTEANKVKNSLFDAENRLAAYPMWEKQVTRGTYGNLSQSLHRNLQQDIAARASPELQAAESYADEYYKKNIVPFKNEVVSPYVSGNKRPIEAGQEIRTTKDPGGIVQDLIQTGTGSDKTYKLRMMLEAMSPEERNLLKAAQLKRAADRQGNINPAKLRTHVGEGKLTQAQYETLYTPAERKRLDAFAERAKLSKEALESMLIPKTGYSATQLATMLGSIGGSVGLGKGAQSWADNHTDSSLLSALAAIAGGIAIPLAGRAGNKILTSEKIRQEIFDRVSGKQISEPVRAWVKAFSEAYGNKKERPKERKLMNLYLNKKIGEK